MFFDFLRRSKKAEELLKEIERLRADVQRIDADVNEVFKVTNAILAKPEDTKMRATVSDLQRKTDEIYDAAALAIQNYDALKAQGVKLAAIERDLGQIKAATASFAAITNTHKVSELEKAISDLQKKVLMPPQPSPRHFSEFSEFTEQSPKFTESSVKPPAPKTTEAEKVRIIPEEPLRVELTDMEKKTFAMLALLISESAEKEAKYDDLIRELYPNVPFFKRRSTVSNFLKKLDSNGLIKRERRGRKAIISLTERGLQLISEENFKRLQKTLMKKEKG